MKRIEAGCSWLDDAFRKHVEHENSFGQMLWPNASLSKNGTRFLQALWPRVRSALFRDLTAVLQAAVGVKDQYVAMSTWCQPVPARAVLIEV